MRWRSGDNRPVIVPVDFDVSVEVGDLVWLDVDDAKPAQAIFERVGLAMGRPMATYFQAQRLLVSCFLGVALQASPRGEMSSIRVGTAGVYEFPCRAGISLLGAYVGAEIAPDGSRLESQRVMLVGKPDRAIGRVARPELKPSTRLYVEISSRVMAPLVPFCDGDTP